MSRCEAEAETILRWDGETDDALLFTADPVEAARWRRLGYDVQVFGTVAGRPRSWQTRVPVAAVALLPIVAGRVQVSRYLGAPTVHAGARKAQGPREPKKLDENAKENRADSPRAEQRRVG